MLPGLGVLHEVVTIPPPPHPGGFLGGWEEDPHSCMLTPVLAAFDALFRGRAWGLPLGPFHSRIRDCRLGIQGGPWNPSIVWVQGGCPQSRGAPFSALHSAFLYLPAMPASYSWRAAPCSTFHTAWSPWCRSSLTLEGFMCDL